MKMSPSNYLAKAIALAANAHKDQSDRAGRPYILHPIRMMQALQDDAHKTVAILHDVVEDTEITLDQLLELGFPNSWVNAVDCLTKRDGEDYSTFVDRALTNPISAQVKLKDLEDNMDLKRLLKPLSPKDVARMQKYHNAWLKIRNHIESAPQA